jgi:hypothetical protein
MESLGHSHSVDQMLSPVRLLALGIQHVLVMYAGGRGAADYRRRAAFSRSASVPSASGCRSSWWLLSLQWARWSA